MVNRGDKMLKDFDLLGKKVKDKVTGLEGIVTSISYDLYGCIQCLITPSVDEKGSLPERWWYDSKRLVVLDHTPVMEVPNFDKEPPGGQELPLP